MLQSPSTPPWVLFPLSQWVDPGRLRGHPALLKHLPRDFELWVTRIESLHQRLTQKMKRCAIYWSSLYRARGKGRIDKTRVIPLEYHRPTEIFPLGVIVSPMIFHLLYTSAEELITLCDIIHQAQTSKMRLLQQWGGILLKVKTSSECIRYQRNFPIRTKPSPVEIPIHTQLTLPLEPHLLLTGPCWKQLNINNSLC